MCWWGGTAEELTALKRRLIERTEGNPFFLEESVRTLVETQVLAGEPGAYRLAQAQAEMQMPPTVQAVLAARIDRLLQEQFADTTITQSELLAYHCTEAGLTEEAVAYWHKAGQQAIQRFANVEAISHLQQGLELLNTLPETPMRNEQELLLLTTLGPAVQVNKGSAAPEMEHIYSRARALCQQVEDSSQLFTVLVGLRRFYLIRGEMRIARELGEQLIRLAARRDEPAALIQAHRSLGGSLFFLGEFDTACHHFEQGIALYTSQPHASHELQDPGVYCLCFASRSRWMLGYATQARRRIQEALDLASTLSQPYNLAIALFNVAMTHYLHRESQKVRELAEAAVAVSTEHGFTFYAIWGTILQGWALSAQSKEEGGLTLFVEHKSTWTPGQSRAS